MTKSGIIERVARDYYNSLHDDDSGFNNWPNLRDNRRAHYLFMVEEILEVAGYFEIVKAAKDVAKSDFDDIDWYDHHHLREILRKAGVLDE